MNNVFTDRKTSCAEVRAAIRPNHGGEIRWRKHLPRAKSPGPEANPHPGLKGGEGFQAIFNAGLHVGPGP